MHFEVLVEDQSGSTSLKFVLEKILGQNGADHSWTMHHYKGIGHLPKDLYVVPNSGHWFLLNHLPSVLRAYGKSLDHSSSVIVVMDLDDKDCIKFKQDLLNVLNACNPRPKTLFRIAIEEIEAWLLGDFAAVKSAYPNVKNAVLNGYVQDSICGTWEVLADAVHSGGSRLLKKSGYQIDGKAKSDWAEDIAPHMDIDANKSKSFQVFRDGVRNLAGIKI